MEKRAVFTICANNYFSQACVLSESLFNIYEGKEIDIFCFVIGHNISNLDYSQFKGKIIFLNEQNEIIPNFLFYALKYNVIEFSTFTKPFVFSYLQKIYQKIVYLDPDIFIVNRLDEIFNNLENKEIVLTPHVVDSPLIPNPDYSFIITNGFFNCGFVAVNSSDVANNFILHWMEDLKINCYIDSSLQLFTDQKSVHNLFFIFHENIFVNKNKGMNIAPWNFYERNVVYQNSKYFILENKQKCDVLFFHMSGFKCSPNQLKNEYFTNKHKLNFCFNEAYIDVFKKYNGLLIKYKFLENKNICYEYEHFSNNLFISRFERRIFRYLFEHKYLKQNENYFLCEKSFYLFLKKNHLLTNNKMALYDNPSLNMLSDDKKLNKKSKIIKSFLKIGSKLLGPNNFHKLSRYLTRQLSYEGELFVVENKIK